MAKIVITKELPDRLMKSLDEGHELVVLSDDEGNSSFQQRLDKELTDAEGLITTKISINKELLEKAPLLKIVSNISVGYDNYDLEAMKQSKVLGTHTPGVLDETVADLTFGLILSSARRIAELDRTIREGGWKVKDPFEFYGSNVHHKTLGIIGMGRIGEKVAKRAVLGFDMSVMYYNRRRKPSIEDKLGVHYATFDEVLSAADFIVVITPLTEETYHLFDADAFKKMKVSAFFINVSRGQTVDETALIEALQTSEIRGAALDVFSQEPIESDNPLLDLENVTLSPHIGSAVIETRFDMAALAVDNVLSYFRDGVPKTVVPELKDLLDEE